MLATRVLAALIFTPTLVGLLVWGGTAAALSCVLLALVLLGEYLQLTLPQAPASLRHASLLLGALTAAQIVGWLPPHLAPLLPGATTMALLLVVLRRPEPLASSINQVALAGLGIAWCCGLLPHLARLRSLPQDGLGLAMMALLCTWASDSGAYFAGRLCGRRPLYPRVSPAKTLEGLGGGVLAALLASAALWAALGLQMSLPAALVLGGLCALGGTAGDLCESLLKRSVGAKDSSRLIPGHGGAFDRFDGVLFAVGLVACVGPLLTARQ